MTTSSSLYFQLRVRKRIVFFFLTLALGLAAGECGQRISNGHKKRKRAGNPYGVRGETALGRAFSEKPGQLVMRHDPHLVYRGRAGLETGGVTINRQGFRGDDWTHEKPSGSRRVAILGGSTAFGQLATHDGTTISAYLERRLAERSLGDVTRIEVLNAGMWGYTTSQELVLLATELVDYDLDAIILFDGFNDMGLGGTGPLSETAGLVHPLFTEMDRALGQAGEHGLNALRWLACVRGIERKIRRADRGLGADHEAAVVLYRRNLAQMCRIARANGCATVICPQPELYHRRGTTPEKELRMRDDQPSRYRSMAVAEYPRYLEAAREVADQERAMFIDGTRAFDDVTEAVFQDRVHLSDRGNEIVADALAGPVARALGLE